MAGRAFAMIDVGLPTWPALRSLTHEARYAYLCAHLTRLASWIGIFEYPRAIFAHDVGLSTEGLSERIAELRRAALIEYDDEAETIRIVGWHRHANSIANASSAISRIGDFSTLGDSPMRLAAIAEFVVGALDRARGWKPDSSDRPKLCDALRAFLGTEYQDHGAALIVALAREAHDAPRAVTRELGVIFQPFADFSARDGQARWGDRDNTVATQKEKTETRPNEDRDADEKENETDTPRGGLPLSSVASQAEPERHFTEKMREPTPRPSVETLRSRLGRANA